MWHKILLFTLFLAGAIFAIFLLLIVASKIWKKYKRDRKHLKNICRLTGASLKIRGAIGEFKRTSYRFFFPSLKSNSLTLRIKAKSPVRLLIVKRGFLVPLFHMLKKVKIDDVELASEYLFYSSNIEIAKRWLRDLAIKDELIGIMNSGCYLLDVRQNRFQIQWKNLSQLELKYLPEWVGEAIDRSVALKNLLLDYMGREDFTINPPVWRYLIIFAISLISFLVIYILIQPLDILYILMISTAVSMPIIIAYFYKIVSFSFRANKICMTSSIALTMLSSILFVSSVVMLAGTIFASSNPRYIKIKSLEKTPLFGDICLEMIKFENSKMVFTPTAICSETKDNLDAKLYRGRFDIFWVDIDRVATKLSLVDIYSAFESGNIPQALRLANKYIELNPGDIYGFYARAKINLKLKNNKKALDDLKSILDLDQRQMDAYLKIDEILTKQRRWKDIILLWTQLIKLEPQNARAYYERAGAYLHNKEIESGKSDLNKSCQLGYEKACKDLKRLFKD